MTDRLAHIDACLTHAEFVPTSVTREDVLALVEIAKAARAVIHSYGNPTDEAYGEGTFAAGGSYISKTRVRDLDAALSVLDDREET